MISRARVSFALLACLVLFASSCSLKRPIKPNWQSVEVAAPSDRILWKVANMSVNGAGFPRGKLDLAAMEIESGWRNDLQPFKGRGNRMRAHIRMEPVELGRWLVEARIQKAINNNLSRPLSLPDADWDEIDDDTVRAQVILQHIVSLMTPADIELRKIPNVYDAMNERLEAIGEDPVNEAGSGQD